MTKPAFNPSKLRLNAITSIKLGIQDFQTSQKIESDGGDPTRALSAVRNLFSGVLLLFKYKITITVSEPKDAYSLIFKPPEVLPEPDGKGGIKWVPSDKLSNNSIDLNVIQKRFKSFKIHANWEAINKLQKCRNHLEHLHPQNSLGEVAEFVAELFPVVRDFLENELELDPFTELGEAWPLMLQHHRFFEDTRKLCWGEWEQVGVSEDAMQYINLSQCECCGSPLIRPHVAVSFLLPNSDLKYVCIKCGNSGLILPLVAEELSNEYSCDASGGDEPTIEECMECGQETFVIGEQKCIWCASELQYKNCNFCGDSLGQEDQMNDGLCSYHHHRMEKVRHE